MNGTTLPGARGEERPKSAPRVTRINVTGLFGIFDHEIPLDSAERVTIIHGPSGFGKTVVLRMIAALGRGPKTIFEHTPFTEFRVTFEDGTERIIRRQTPPKTERGGSPVNLAFLIRDRSGAVTQLPAPELPTLPHSLLREIDQSVPSPYRLREPGYWVDNRGRQFSLSEILEKFPDAGVMLPASFRTRRYFPESLDLPVFFIETNRLGADPSRQERNLDDDGQLTRHPDLHVSRRGLSSRVKQYSEDLIDRIKSVLGEYAKNSQDSDRTFPARLVKFVPGGGRALPERQILDRMEQIEKKRLRLISLGLLDSESGLANLSEEDIRHQPEALTIYVGDVQQKLSVFDDLAGRIGILKDIINNRFQYKELKIDREQGFEVLTGGGQPIQLEDLSSGEQHELVVLYELLFRAPENALVLIDEPEISLHAAWQKRFLPDLIDILQVTDAYAIVATHSPMIIGERWDLTRKLVGLGSRLRLAESLLLFHA